MSPQYGMPMGYISSQTVTPTNVMGAQYTYSDPIVSISSSANISRTNDLVPHVSPVPPQELYATYRSYLKLDVQPICAVLAKLAEIGQTAFPIWSDRFPLASQTGCSDRSDWSHRLTVPN